MIPFISTHLLLKVTLIAAIHGDVISKFAIGIVGWLIGLWLFGLTFDKIKEDAGF